MKYMWSYIQKIRSKSQVKRLHGINYEELNQLIELCRSQHEKTQKLKESN